MNRLSELKEKFRSVWPLLDERTRRIMAADEAIVGHGGMTQVHRASGLSRKAIAKGFGRSVRARPGEGRIRRAGAGRKPLTQSDPRLIEALES